MRTPEYNSYFQSEQWREKRREKLLEVSACEHCGTSAQLHVHHLTYKRLGAELMTDLQVLCKSCHSRVHHRAVGGHVLRRKRRRGGVVGKLKAPPAWTRNEQTKLKKKLNAMNDELHERQVRAREARAARA